MSNTQHLSIVGTRIVGTYRGEKISGIVESSRVSKRKVMHTITLDNPVKYRWRTGHTSQILIADDELISD
jgi:hypothetical protein